MDLKIITVPFVKDLYGYSGIITNNQPGATGFRLMDQLWKTVKEHNLSTTGINYWVYLPGNELFAAVEMKAIPANLVLKHKKMSINEYAWYKHIGPYSQLGMVYKAFAEELASRQLKTGYPYIEIYGHHSDDESKCETELIMGLD